MDLGIGTIAVIFFVTLGITMLVLGPGAKRRRSVQPGDRPTRHPVPLARDPSRIGDVEGFVRGATYRVLAPFSARGDSFAEGESLTYEDRSFVPYHGGHTLRFTPRPIYLQEDDDSEILGNLDRYFVRET